MATEKPWSEILKELGEGIEAPENEEMWSQRVIDEDRIAKRKAGLLDDESSDDKTLKFPPTENG